MFNPIPRSINELPLSEASFLLENRQKDDFMAALAHELRNPLTPICAGIELLKQGGDDPVVVLLARSMMERQAKHMARMIDDLTDISKIARGRLDLQFEPVSLESILQSAAEACRPNLETLEQRLSVSRVPHDAVVNGDATRLYEVFCNVFNNAIKYTPARGEVRVMTRRELDRVIVAVEDDGIGMTAEELAHIFETFWQVKQGSQRSNGLGIGLALAERLVHLHSGEISASSPGLGCGSTFTISLPAASKSPSPFKCGIPAPDSAPAPQKILVADDNRDCACGLALLLERSGHEVRIAVNGADALAVYAEFTPTVVFLDLVMPILDGYEVARAIRKNSHESKPLLIAISGWGQEKARLRATAAGFDHHLVKPFAFEELESVLSEGVLSEKGPVDAISAVA
ncbi:MAG TPA: ATP-binding protein [Steroidobacteraceae bacterium]|jgi:CheY-like chemotaxis protein/two-component sensor histidine kinase|nr:ATP-binding protein [Steroidobacteraceae bacterium]